MARFYILDMGIWDVPRNEMIAPETEEIRAKNLRYTISGFAVLKVAIIKATAPVRVKVQFHYYRLAKGVTAILAYAKEGVRLWFKTKRPRYRQLRFRFVC